MDYLVKQILEKDPGAIQTAKGMGSLVSELIKPLTNSEDEGVRQIALRALKQSGGGGSAEIFTNALLDKAPSVRAAALNALQQHTDPETYSRLLRTYENVSDPQHRQEIGPAEHKCQPAQAEVGRRLGGRRYAGQPAQKRQPQPGRAAAQVRHAELGGCQRALQQQRVGDSDAEQE